VANVELRRQMTGACRLSQRNSTGTLLQRLDLWTMRSTSRAVARKK